MLTPQQNVITNQGKFNQPLMLLQRQLYLVCIFSALAPKVVFPHWSFFFPFLYICFRLLFSLFYTKRSPVYGGQTNFYLHSCTGYCKEDCRPSSRLKPRVRRICLRVTAQDLVDVSGPINDFLSLDHRVTECDRFNWQSVIQSDSNVPLISSKLISPHTLVNAPLAEIARVEVDVNGGHL